MLSAVIPYRLPICTVCSRLSTRAGSKAARQLAVRMECRLPAALLSTCRPYARNKVSPDLFAYLDNQCNCSLQEVCAPQQLRKADQQRACWPHARTRSTKHLYSMLWSSQQSSSSCKVG
jgi:hypothetical protein